MKKERIDLSVKICQNLPLDLTINEKNGICKKPEFDCNFQLCHSLPICRKKTTTSLPLPNLTI